MKVLVTGSGGREHGLAWRLARSERVSKVYVAPGNAGTAFEEITENLDIDVMDFDALIRFVQKNDVDLTIVGPEAPLVAGIVDRFQREGLACFGPTAAAAQLEGSKTFSKDFLKRHEIPTASYGSFEDADLAVEFARNMTMPVVIKADGLAAGKGVVISHTHEDAESTIRDMLSGHAFGEAGARVVVEQFLDGEEASYIVVSDGNHFIPFATSQDHKAIFDGDRGPNTGGMGAYSPAPVVTSDVEKRVIERIIKPTLEGMKAEGYAYTGFLYAGLMIDEEGDPRVIEFNCRFGDPETQPLMMRMKSDLATLCMSAISGNLNEQDLEFVDQVAMTVVAASEGYPGDYEKGKIITGLDQETTGKVFHAGTALHGDQVITNGGRVLGVTALGSTTRDAQKAVYEILEHISYEGIYYRKDIGYRAIERES